MLLSGGRDSACLLDLAVSIAGAGAVTALHVNYGLREAAGDDERHCAGLCERFGVRLEVRRPRRPESGNLQAWARDERYGAAAALALELDGDVASGHTATDQLETILYRLASSPSRRALLGMRPREGRLVRPPLPFTREETAAWCRDRGLEWRQDETNESDPLRARARAARAGAGAACDPPGGAAERARSGRGAGGMRPRRSTRSLTRRSRGPRDPARGAAIDTPGALRRLVVQRLAERAASGGLAPGAARRADEVAAL